MKWIKKGNIYRPQSKHEWMASHAQCPVVKKINEDKLRIYFGTRDDKNRTLTTFIEVDAHDPSKILYEHDKAILPLGKLGMFDDSGVMPSDIIDYNGRTYLYYMGWNNGGNVSYRIANGAAVSDDGGITFKRLWEGPIMDRNRIDPLGVSLQRVIIDNGLWKTWYLSFTKWELINGQTEPFYTIKYAESKDGVNWERGGDICIELRTAHEAVSAPFVIKEDYKYKMWYSYRTGVNYRLDKNHSYRIGYAESDDGIVWTRKDDLAGIRRSPNGWDSDMTANPYVYQHSHAKYLFYNGNGFGKTGFGFAVLSDED
jgi:predicted GH43/DUF377 family glycosyl hydrolase